ncbi:MAG: hypothetical protein M3494_10150 [Actinomycetota bacterium]|nr:hypothetical protein [Rubrobacter sp.]MDQ3508361.1 hypothetical protein [Actinomycetota bacterium]
MKPSLAPPPANNREEMEAPTSPRRKILAFTALVFVVFSGSVTALLLHLGQGAFASLLAGFFVGATAAIEVGWFGGRAFFGEDA